MLQQFMINRDRSYTCKFCHSKFAQKGNMKAHVEPVHEGKKHLNVTFVTTFLFSRNT